MTQMLVHYATSVYARFKTAFDADAEDRGRNGLSLLQLWKAADGSAWALFQIGDAAKARAFVSGKSTAFNAQAGVTTDFHLIETA